MGIFSKIKSAVAGVDADSIDTNQPDPEAAVPFYGPVVGAKNPVTPEQARIAREEDVRAAREIARQVAEEAGMQEERAADFAAFPLRRSTWTIVAVGAGGVDGRSEHDQRIARHLWRMCMALFIAAGAFFFAALSVITTCK